MSRLFTITTALAIGMSGMIGGPTAAQTLVVGNKGEDTVSFVDLASGRERARVPTGRMPHEVAISPDGRQAAVVAYGSTTIDVFDVKTATKLRTIDLSPNTRPHGLVWLRDGTLVATAEGSGSIALVRPDGSVASVATGAKGSHMLAVEADGARAFVANMGSGSVGVIDLVAGRKLRDIAVGGKPEGLTLSRDGRQLWVGDNDGGRVQIFSTADFRRLGEVAVGPTPIRVVASPDGRTIVTSNHGDGTLSLIDASTRRMRRTIAVGGAAAAQVTILFSRDGKRLYVAETGPNQVAEVDLSTGHVLRRLSVGRDGDGLGIAP